MYTELSREVLPELISPNSRIMAAVSGGPDSVAMAHILWRYVNDHQEQNLSLIVNHVHHGVRQESDQEEILVRELAEKWQIPLIVHKFEAKKHAEQNGASFQEAAREWRYTRWHLDMQENNCQLLATAHHLGDQAETVIYRLLRGSGTAGLAGIYPARDQIIRPLLSVGKEEILAYCQKENLNYALDKSNLEPLYDRNKIRIEVIPILEGFNPRLEEALGRTAELLRWDEDFIEDIVHIKWQEYCLENTSSQVGISYKAWSEKEAILSRLVRKAAAIVAGDPRGLEYKFIKRIMKEGRNIGWSQDLPGMKVEARKNGFYIFRGELEKVHINHFLTAGQSFEMPILKECWQSIPGGIYKVGIFEEIPEETEIIYSTVIDKEQLEDSEEPLVCRTRRRGDRMFFKGLGHKSLKKVFQERGIPSDSRANTPLIAQGSLIIWIPGIRRSDSFFPTDDSIALNCILALEV